MLNTDPMRRRLGLGAGIASLVLAASACASGSSAEPTVATPTTAASMAASESAAESTAAGPSVTITSTSSFGAADITVPTGETLTVINNSSAPHTFTEGENGSEADNARVNEDIAVGASVEVTFPEPGDYNVTCLFHSAMNMVVHVQ